MTVIALSLQVFQLNRRCTIRSKNQVSYHVKEFSFVSNQFHVAKIMRSLRLQSLLLVLIGLCASATAQTAPQLLPYTAKLVAGGGTTTLPLTVSAGACKPSGNTPTDIYGDGCLATDLVLSGPRYAVADKNGNIFFSDYANGLIRRVDATTGIITAVAGGVTYANSPSISGSQITTAPSICATGSATVPTDYKGDGCLGTQVFLANPTGLVFSPAGDLYFSEVGNSSSPQEKVFGGDVRKIAATNGVITTTGVISTVDGALSSYYTYGYTANNYTATTPCSATNLTNCIVAATSSYLDAPYGLAFDASGNLYISEEGKEAVLVVNTSANTNTVTGVSIPAGTVAKIVGYSSTGGVTCPNGDSGTTGCTAGLFTGGASANSSEVHYPYAVAVDQGGNVYFANEYPYDAVEITSAGIINNYAGKENADTPAPTNLSRGAAGSFAIGGPHGIAADTYANSNIYVTDVNYGIVWRVDGTGKYMYAVAGGASSVCSTATDSYGDGCPALKAKFGTGSSNGLYGVSVDSNADLFTTDTVSNLVREISSGTQFGAIGDNQPTQNVDIHFAAGDAPATYAYALTSGSANFSLGTASCTFNSDTTEDCVLPITATPTGLGAFSGTLQVTSAMGGVASFPLSGTFVQTPLTRTAVAASQAASCTNTSAYSTTTPVILTATLFSDGPSAPGGTMTFYSNGSQIGTAQNVVNNSATLTYTFSTAGPYNIYAVYSGDTYYDTSTSTTIAITSAAATMTAQATSYQSSTVVPGQTALYSFNIMQNVYTGTLTFSCAGLPANASCVFSTPTITATGCYVTNTVALSIVTQQASSQLVSSIGIGGHGPWSILSIVVGVLLALMVGYRRRSMTRFRQLWMVVALLLTSFGTMSCGSGAPTQQATPAGTYTITVTVTGSTGATSSFTVPLTVS